MKEEEKLLRWPERKRDHESVLNTQDTQGAVIIFIFSECAVVR